MLPPINSRCFCGDVTFRATAAPLWQAQCRCESCRRAKSSGLASLFGAAHAHREWTGARPATFAASKGVWRNFCPRCGSHMAYCAARYPGEIHFHAATLDDPTRFSPTAHVHSDEQLPWIHPSDGFKRK